MVTQTSACPLGEKALRWWGYREPVNDGVLKTLSEAEQIQDYFETAYLEGSAGCMAYLYWAGGPSCDSYSLVDIHGDDYQGKWSAVKKAAANIRKWEGAPSCRITSPEDKSWVSIGANEQGKGKLKISVDVEAPVKTPVKIVKADYSTDGCLTWKPLADDITAPYEYVLGLNDVGDGLNNCWIRAQAINKQGPSLWDVVEISLQCN